MQETNSQVSKYVSAATDRNSDLKSLANLDVKSLTSQPKM